jgi:hypothetical protein
VSDSGPEIQDIALGRATRVKALKDLFAQMNRKGFLVLPLRVMHRAAAASLQAPAAELLEKTQMAQHLFHRQLLTQEGEVYLRSRGRRVDRGQFGLYAGRSRGDHLLGGTTRIVAHGFVVVGGRGDCILALARQHHDDVTRLDN